MSRCEQFGRVTAHNPGKHGPGDWRVEFNGAAPTHAEVVFLVGMLLLAEDRYPRDALGRRFLWIFLDAASRAFTVDAVRDVAGEVDRSKHE